MTQRQPLLRPLRSEDLLPRPPAQAAWDAGAVRPPEPPAAAETEESSIPLSPPEPAACEPAQQEYRFIEPDYIEEEPAPEETLPPASPVPSDAEKPVSELSIPPAKPAPVLVCEPFFAQTLPKKRPIRWKWPLIYLLVISAGLLAAWYLGWLSEILP